MKPRALRNFSNPQVVEIVLDALNAHGPPVRLQGVAKDHFIFREGVVFRLDSYEGAVRLSKSTVKYKNSDSISLSLDDIPYRWVAVERITNHGKGIWKRFVYELEAQFGSEGTHGFGAERLKDAEQADGHCQPGHDQQKCSHSADLIRLC